MRRIEGERPVVIDVELERVYSPNGSFTIHQFAAESVEHIEIAVADLRRSGRILRLADSSDQTTQPIDHPRIRVNGRGVLPVTRYLLEPAPVADIELSNN